MAQKELKGKDPEEKLMWHTPEVKIVSIALLPMRITLYYFAKALLPKLSRG